MGAADCQFAMHHGGAGTLFSAKEPLINKDKK
jgi:hypothetical protein